MAGLQKTMHPRPFLLGVDVGNTTITFALLDGKRILRTFCLETERREAALKKQLVTLLQPLLARGVISRVMICSVVPPVLKIIKSVLNKMYLGQVLVVGEDLKVPIPNHYRNPRQVGQDRLVCAYAAKKYYAAPVVVIDFGTAITLDVVSKQGHYLGGLIVPGIRLSLESLFKKTALLPLIAAQRPAGLIGRDTKNSILSGIFYGYGAMCDRLLDLLKKESLPGGKVVVTGGHVDIIKDFIEHPLIIDKTLIFKGLQLLDENFQPSESLRSRPT